MTMKFLKKKAQTENPEASRAYSPYVAARQEWAERYGEYIHTAYVWRVFAIVTLVILCFSVVGNIMQTRQRKIIPYIIQVDQLGKSNINQLAPPTQLPREFIQSELANFVINWRTVTADFDLQKKMINKLGAYTAGTAKGSLKEWYDKNNPYQIAKQGRLVQISIKGLPLPVSKDSWRVEWQEITRNQTGQLMNSVTYEATLSIAVQPPKTEEQIMLNPGGITVFEVSYSKVLNAN